MRKLLRLLPVRFFVASLVYLTLGVVFGALDALGYGNFKSVHAHLIAGAFFTLVIMGSMYQLIPTIIGTEIRYKRLAEIQFILVNIAFISLAYSFLIEYSFLKVAGFIAFVSFLIFAIEIYATTLNVKNFYKLSLAIWFFLAAVAYLIIGSAYALTGALGITGFNILEHAHILTIGFIAMTTFGGFYELFPMLALKKLYSRRLGEIHFFIANIAAIGMFLSFSQKGSLFIFSSIVFLLGFYLFAFNIAKTYLSKVNTPAPETDISARFMAYALIFGVAGVTAGLSSALTGFPGSFTHVHYILAGWVGLTMVGAMYHIVPMLTWIQKYSAKAGKEKVPLINELYNKQLAKAIFITMNISLALFGLRSFLPALNLFSVPLAAAFLAFAVEMVLILKR